MEYIKKILSNSGKIEGTPKKNTRKKLFVNVVNCVYCGGSGVDQKYQNGGNPCMVCRGTGTNKVKPPVIACRTCGGSGREGGKDLTCLTCKGIGYVSVSKDADVCSKCHGTGKDGVFYCMKCNGQGIV